MNHMVLLHLWTHTDRHIQTPVLLPLDELIPLPPWWSKSCFIHEHTWSHPNSCSMTTVWTHPTYTLVEYVLLHPSTHMISSKFLFHDHSMNSSHLHLGGVSLASSMNTHDLIHIPVPRPQYELIPLTPWWNMSCFIHQHTWIHPNSCSLTPDEILTLLCWNGFRLTWQRYWQKECPRTKWTAKCLPPHKTGFWLPQREKGTATTTLAIPSGSSAVTPEMGRGSSWR